METVVTASMIGGMVTNTKIKGLFGHSYQANGFNIEKEPLGTERREDRRTKLFMMNSSACTNCC